MIFRDVSFVPYFIILGTYRHTKARLVEFWSSDCALKALAFFSVYFMDPKNSSLFKFLSNFNISDLELVSTPSTI
jgi:hypothetical protein